MIIYIITPLLRMSPANDTLSNVTDNPSKSHDNLKCLSMNCWSLISISKKANFLSLIDEYKPDIVCGFESHLDNTYFTNEILPPNYFVLRKDRIEGAGGVFICVEKSLNVTEMPELNTDAELIWAKETLRT